VTLAVTGKTISGRDFRSQRTTVFERHQNPLTGNRRDMRCLIGRRTKPTFCVFFCVFAVSSIAVMEKCCEACGDEEYHFRSDFPASESASISESSNAVDRKSMGHAVSDLASNEADFLCIFLCISCISGSGFGKVL
jgi:hypothetical protein